MDFFNYRQGEAFCEDVALDHIAKEVGTPCYVYSLATLRRHALRLQEAFASYPTLPCFAVKANGNLSVLREIFSMGYGADIVSLGELERALRAGVRPDWVVYSGVGKRRDEIEAALAQNIFSFNVESVSELEEIAAIASHQKKQARVTLRVNPNIDAKTNPKITTGLFSTKFGLVEEAAQALATRIRSLPSVRLVGVGCHIGSQILEVEPLAEAAKILAAFAQRLMAQGHPLECIDMGGGLGIRYRTEDPPEPERYAKAIIEAVRPTGLKLLIEPGRVLVGNIGVLLTRVIATKETPEKAFLIVDGAMNDLIRPSMYDSYHEIRAVHEKGEGAQRKLMDVVGPICETGDFFGKDRQLPVDLKAGDLVYLRSAGAYAAAMASNYNSRPRAPEILVDGAKFRIVRRRESLEDLWRHEEMTWSENSKPIA